MIFGQKIDDNSHGARGGLGQLWVDQMNLLVLVNSGTLNKNLGVIEAVSVGGSDRLATLI